MELFSATENHRNNLKSQDCGIEITHFNLLSLLGVCPHYLSLCICSRYRPPVISSHGDIPNIKTVTHIRLVDPSWQSKESGPGVLPMTCCGLDVRGIL